MPPRQPQIGSTAQAVAPVIMKPLVVPRYSIAIDVDRRRAGKHSAARAKVGGTTPPSVSPVANRKAISEAAPSALIVAILNKPIASRHATTSRLDPILGANGASARRAP